MMLHNRTILLIITGGIAAYKGLELIRLLRKAGARIVPVLTKSGAQFITPLSVSALAQEQTYTDLFSLTDEVAMGHIRLSRMADLVVVAPCSANLMAKMAQGLADDLASTLLLASNKPVMLAPAMNPVMWAHEATQHNVALLKERGLIFVGPDKGDMACGEDGAGRMAEPAIILESIEGFFAHKGPLNGKKALVTAGPTLEAIDPVRFISNHSSGKQGYAVAAALAAAGADVTLVSGPVVIPAPKGIKTIYVTSAVEMLKAVEDSLPVVIAVCAAAVADWRPEKAGDEKMKKAGTPPVLMLIENPDILKTLSTHPQRPQIVVGFAAETENLAENARAKIQRKGCDMLLANDVSQHVFGADDNAVLYLDKKGTPEAWPRMGKDAVAKELVQKIIERIKS